MVDVKWEKPAQDRHEAWALQIAHTFSLSHARTYLAEIQSAEQKIAAHPHIGTEIKFGRPGLRRFVTPSGYSIFYQLNNPTQPTQAIIVSILRGQQNSP